MSMQNRMEKNEKQRDNIKSAAKYFVMFCILLIYYELLLRGNMTGGIRGKFLFFLCFVPSEALALTALCGWFKGRMNAVVTCIWLALIAVYYIAQLIYYKNFGSLFSASMMGMGGEALQNFGWTIVDVVKKARWSIGLMILPVLIYIVLASVKCIKPGKIDMGFRIILLAMILPVWIMGISGTRIGGTGRQTAYAVLFDAMSGTDNTASHLGALTTTVIECCSGVLGTSVSAGGNLVQVDENILMESGTPKDEVGKNSGNRASDSETGEPNSGEDPSLKGPNGKENASGQENPGYVKKAQIWEEIDFEQLAKIATEPELQELSQYLGSRGVSYTNEYTGIFEGYNLIYICGEAFWSYAIDEKVTPTLYKMANQGVILNNYYNSFKNTTTNGEFAFATSLWPDLSRVADSGTDVGSFYQSATCYMPVGLGDLFNEQGVTSRAYHNYYGEYYRRILSWPNLGYDCKFLARGLRFTTIWPASDLELMEQTVDDYIGDDRFHAYYMTFSGHGPYGPSNFMYQKNINAIKELMGDGLNQEVYGYMAGNYELDKAMEYLLERLEEAGKLDNTVIVIAGDHYPYNLSDKGREALVGYKMDTDFEMYKSTCIIYNAGLKENIVTDTYCSNVDILPTVLNLLGISYDSRLYMGRDVFSEGVHKAVLYNMSFITDMVRYNSLTDECEWSEGADAMDENQKDRYLENMINLVNSEYSASVRIIGNNYYQYVWYNSGLMTDEDVEEEEKRVRRVREKDVEYNIKDAERAAEEQTLENIEEN
ncbi:MAG: LTA synthase family protein [Lachnospiraceae bacterium]